MMRSMYSGVSGLKNHQIRMDSIGNNIANVNTVGFKASRVNFQDTLNQTMRGATAPSGDGSRGGINPMQIGLGMNVASIDVLHTQGNLQNTGQLTDLAIQGDGFFILSDGSQQYYTRAGNFIKDESGKIVNSSNGLMVRGWIADTTGVINTNAPVINLQLPVGMTIEPRATTEIEFGGAVHPDIEGVLRFENLTVDIGGGNTAEIEFTVTRNGFYDYQWTANIVNSTGVAATLPNNTGDITIEADPSDPNFLEILTSTGALDVNFATLPQPGPGTTVNVTLPVVGTVADNSFFDFAGPPVSTSQATFHPVQPVVTTSRVYDSLGVSHTLVTTYNKIGTNLWSWSVADQDGLPVTQPPAAARELAFTNNTNPSTLAGGPIQMTPLGAQTMDITLDFSEIRQGAERDIDNDEPYISPTSIETYDQNGYAMGTLNGFNIGKTGIIIGSFTNGETRNLGQVAVANFTNPGGLVRVGDTMFAESSNSGNVRIGVPGSGGRGLVTPGAIEMSNVDLSNEFTDMIVTERGFQANSRIITTSDEMLQELVNLKR